MQKSIKDSTVCNFFCVFNQFQKKMAHLPISYHYTSLPSQSEYSIRPQSYMIDKVKLMGMIKSMSPIGELAKLCRVLSIEQPKYTVHTIVDNKYSICTVEFAEQEFTSSLLRTLNPLAMEDAAELAISHFLMNPSTFSYLDIPNLIPTLSPILALGNLCHEKGWTVKFNFTGSKKDGWRCGVSVKKGEEIASLGEEGEFLTKRDAKLDAAAAMYDWLFE